MNPPVISVIMSVYNGSQFVSDAIYSILNQTFGAFEFIIIDDGSTDDTADLVKQIPDPRIQLIEQENQGLTLSLNQAIRLSRGQYIARMDADDFAQPDRFARQVDFLNDHPDVVLLGTAFEQIYTDTGRLVIIKPATDDLEIRKQLLDGNSFCHASVMMRATTLREVNGYDESFRYLQDYELWSRLALHGRLANLPDVLMKRYDHTGSISNNWRTEVYRWQLFRRANHLAIDRLDGRRVDKLRTYQTILIFALSRLKREFMRRNLSS